MPPSARRAGAVSRGAYLLQVRYVIRIRGRREGPLGANEVGVRLDGYLAVTPDDPELLHVHVHELTPGGDLGPEVSPYRFLPDPEDDRGGAGPSRPVSGRRRG